MTRFGADDTLDVGADVLVSAAARAANADSRKQIDVNVRFIQHREDQDLSWWAGVGYKHNLDDGGGQSLVLLPNATVRIGKFRVGYAFNLDLNKLVSHNYGTHELMLGYSFCHTSKFCR